VTVRWVDGKPNAKWWPKSGWKILGHDVRSDKVEVWFQKGEDNRFSEIKVWSDGRSEVKEWRCSGEWGTPSWRGCKEV
jgi:hypothetical protein